MVKRLPAMREASVWSLGREDPLEKEMGKSTHSSTLAWKIPWTEEPCKLQSTGLQSRARLSDVTSLHLIQERWGGTWDVVFLTTLQVMLKLLVKPHTLGATAVGLLQMWKLISREGELLILEKTSCDSCLFHFYSAAPQWPFGILAHTPLTWFYIYLSHFSRVRLCVTP